jgi:hypothetical protein
MTDTVGPERRMVQGDDEFERRLFTMIEAGELDFPKGAVRPGDEAAPRSGFLRSFRSSLARLLPRFPRLFLTAAVAYSVALVVSLPAYLVLFPRTAPPVASDAPPTASVFAPAVAPAPAPAVPSIGNARVVELGAGPTRAGAGTTRITIGPQDAYVVLSFLVPIRTGPGLTYHATITDSTGRVVAAQESIRSIDTLGNFVLVCSSGLFTAGEFRLTVVEVPASGTAEEHRFTFQVSRPRD